ncbi:MAG: response regulator [Alphaproteobacteria bacterium]
MKRTMSAFDTADASSAVAHSEINPLVLLVEDNADNMLVATSLLEMLGIRHETACNGQEAFEKARGGGFDVILMDVQMPEMDGFTATRMIRDYEERHGFSRIPIVGVTAYALAGDRERCLAAGMDDYISKPFRADDLESKIILWHDAKHADAEQ